jgi:hypothetical protein
MVAGVTEGELIIKNVYDFEKLREVLISKKQTEPDYIRALGVLEGLLNITEPMDIKPSMKIHSENKGTRVRRHILRKLDGKVLSIEFEEKIYHGHYSVQKGLMTFLNGVKDSKPDYKHTNLFFSYGSPAIPNVISVDEAILLLKTYTRAMKTVSYKKELLKN